MERFLSFNIQIRNMHVQVPYLNKEISLEKYLFSVLESHMEKTPYWKRNLNQKIIEDTVIDNLDETLYNLSKLEVDQNLLSTKWLDFKPINLKYSRTSFSSGTTGPQKNCKWSMSYINDLAKYLHYHLSLQGIQIQSAILQGPTSVYKDVNERLVDLFGGDPYFVGLRVEGIKPIMEDAARKGPQELIRVVKEYFAPEIEKTKIILKNDDNVNFMRSAWMMLASFEKFFGNKRNIDTVMVSGLGYSPQNHEMLLQKFKNVIPSYGYFAFGDALGKYSNGNIDYYPPFPHAIFGVIKEDGEIAKYGEEGNPLFVIARPDLFLVLKESNEFVRRARPVDEFNWDGIRNPYRKI